MTPERIERFKKVVKLRQPNLTVILENVHDLHNIGAVMRSCDSVGIFEIYVLQSRTDIQYSKLILGKRTSAGTRKWVDVHYFTDVEKCFEIVKSKYGKVFATHLDANAKSLYDLNLAEPMALLFGNEHDGVSDEALSFCDGNFIIPQVGMVQSLNISVACAVTLFEAYRQRAKKGFFNENIQMQDKQQEELFNEYVKRHEGQVKRKFAHKKDGT